MSWAQAIPFLAMLGIGDCTLMGIAFMLYVMLIAPRRWTWGWPTRSTDITRSS